MKIMIPVLPKINIIQALRHSIVATEGVDLIDWHMQHKPIIDMCDEQKPDVVILHEDHADMGAEIACSDHSFKLIIIKSSDAPWKLSRKPDLFLTNPLFEKNFSPSMSYRAVASSYLVASDDIDYSSDVLIDTSGVAIDSQAGHDDIMRLVTTIVSLYPNSKIIGDLRLSLHHYLGRASEQERIDMIKQAKVLVDLSGSGYWDAAVHSTAPVVLHKPNPSADGPPVPESVLSFSGLSEAISLVDGLMRDDTVRDHYVEITNKESMAHLHYKFAAEVFSAINEPEIAKSIMKIGETKCLAS